LEATAMVLTAATCQAAIKKFSPVQINSKEKATWHVTSLKQ